MNSTSNTFRTGRNPCGSKIIRNYFMVSFNELKIIIPSLIFAETETLTAISVFFAELPKYIVFLPVLQEK